jgi:hypothetical protein
MSKLNKLAQLNKIANDCIQDGDLELASKFHNEFMKIAQVDRDDRGAMLRAAVAKGMGLTPDVSDAELLANVIRVCDYIRPERIRNPNQPSAPNNVMLRSMGGATPENSYSDEYWKNCENSFNSLVNPNVAKNMKMNVVELRQAARVGDIKTVLSRLASGT